MTGNEKLLHTLTDEVMVLEISLNKAYFMNDEISQGFFVYNGAEEHKIEILWEYERYQAYSEILSDYIFELKKQIKELQNTLNNALTEIKKENAA